MGISFSIPCDPCVNKFSLWVDEKVGYTHKLEKNLDNLEKAMQVLKAKRDDLRVTREEGRGQQKRSEFQVWLDQVETIEKKVTELLNARDVELQRLCLCGFCSKSILSLSSYRYGKSVFLKLNDVNELYKKDFKEIADPAQTPEVVEIQLPPIIVGQKTMLEKAWKHLKEDGVDIMGLYGMGGVGKTTLLKQINNMFCNDRCGFDYVIWVKVSKELNVERILDDIAQQVGHGGEEWNKKKKEEWNKKDKNQKTDFLFNFLKKKRFVLFLDDIWEKVDLAEIGVPDPRSYKGCKVAFTTRDKAVCTSMGAKPILEVQCLAEKEAFDLFQKKVGQETLGSDPGIPALAREVAKKCCGLPLALNVIGETMSCKETIEEWRHAIHVLNSNAAKYPDVEKKILRLLKYSYDDLKEEHIKSCLLYCALFPDDDQIHKEKLIEYWIGEGIIDGKEGIETAENEGYGIIASLVRGSLLMEGVNEDGKACVSMHDVVRETALWIASELGKQEEAFIVRVGLSKIPQVNNWKVVRRMSLMKNRIYHLAGSPECLELTTLLMQGTKFERGLSEISSEFFKSMPKLAVLDLSGNEYLSKLPNGISNLVSLQYLNLSGTGIHELSKGLKELKKLIHLDLEYTSQLKSIAGISSLHNLKVLKLVDSGLPWDLDIVKELEALEHLEILTIKFDHGRMLKQILSSHRLMSCTRFLGIERRGNVDSYGISFPETIDKLRELRIYDCRIPEIKMDKLNFSSLVKVSIFHCPSLRELTFLMFAPNLRFLQVKWADDLEDIINEEKACQVENSERILPFEKLNQLHLFCVLKLKNIYWSPLRFPCLQTITINLCPNLKKLPLDSKSGKHGDNGLFIKYSEKEWIEGVEWEDEATKTRFLSSCRYVKFDFGATKSWRLG